MKTIKTRLLGEREVSEEQLVTFNKTLFGFEQYKSFYLLDMDDDGLFKVLQSEEDENLCFVVISPSIVFPWYELHVHESDLEDLEIKELENLIAFVIVTIPDEMRDMTANLQGPILINKCTKQGKQCIALNDGYTTRHRIFEASGVEA